METTIMGYIGVMLGYISGLYWDNGKDNGNYYLGFSIKCGGHWVASNKLGSTSCTPGRLTT